MADQNMSNNQPGGPGGNAGNNGGRRNPADNLSHQDRVRGGERSAAMQNRDSSGQFAGRKKGDGGTQGQNAARQQQQEQQQGNSGMGAGRNAGNTNR